MKGKEVGSVLGLLLSGAVASVLAKTAYQTKSVGLLEDPHYFAKPWFLTTLQYTAMALCLLLYEFASRALLRARSDLQEKHEQQPQKVGRLTQFGYLVVPSLLGVCGGTLINTTLIWVPASICEMLKMCLRVVFTAILSNRCLGKKFGKVRNRACIVMNPVAHGQLTNKFFSVTS